MAGAGMVSMHSGLRAGHMFWAYVPSSETNCRSDGWMLVRTLACARTGRSAGTVMVANRFLGNPTDRDDTEACGIVCATGAELRPLGKSRESPSDPTACAPPFYPNNLQLLRPERISLVSAAPAG